MTHPLILPPIDVKQLDSARLLRCEIASEDFGAD